MKLKGLGGMLARYAAAAVGVGIFLLIMNISAFIYIIMQSKTLDNSVRDRIGVIANGVTQNAKGDFSVSHEARQALDERYEWAMQLDDNGNVLWEDRMPKNLPRHFSVPDAASFAKWYLGDYPVYCLRNSSGLIVMASAPGSEWKYNVTMNMQSMEIIIGLLPAALMLNFITALVLSMLLGWGMYRAASPVAQAINQLAKGETIELPEKGVLKLIASDLNKASSQLLAQRTALQKRDRTRTEWIAGISHDIRTPLSLVQGNAAQLENDKSLPENVNQKASLIRSQSQRIGRLVSDLNLASKLEYELQPLRKTTFRPAAMLRAAAADALNECDESRVYMEADIRPSAASLQTTGDETLIRRALDNLLRNSINHNEGTIHITISLSVETDVWKIQVADDGAGLSPEQLHLLSREIPETLPSHGLGLILVRQIARAHDGSAVFVNTYPGLCTTLSFPL